MIRVKLPMGGITPEQLEAFADVDREVRAAEQGPHHDAPEHPDAPRAAAPTRPSSSASSPTPGCPAARAAATPCATSPATRGPASAHDELFDLTPYAGAYVRYFVRHPTTQLMPRKIKTAFTAADEDRAITGIHDIAFIPRVREIDGVVQGVEMRVGGGTSIMPRVAPTLYDFVAARRRRVPEGLRGRAADLRPPGLAAQQPRPRAHQGADRQDRHRRLPRAGRGGAAGRLGGRARLRPDAAPASIDDEEANAPAPPPQPG